jgi:hypothetical protein
MVISLIACASPPGPIGRHAEPRIVQIVAELIAGSNNAVQTHRGKDNRVADARHAVGAMEHSVAVTGVPHAPVFWKRVSLRCATTTATLREVAGWLEDVANAKLAGSPTGSGARTLALDSHDWADHMIQRPVIVALTSGGLNPAERLGLGGIAITGQQASNSTWVPGFLR